MTWLPNGNNTNSVPSNELPRPFPSRAAKSLFRLGGRHFAASWELNCIVANATNAGPTRRSPAPSRFRSPRTEARERRYRSGGRRGDATHSNMALSNPRRSPRRLGRRRRLALGDLWPAARVGDTFKTARHRGQPPDARNYNALALWGDRAGINGNGRKRHRFQADYQATGARLRYLFVRPACLRSRTGGILA